METHPKQRFFCSNLPFRQGFGSFSRCTIFILFLLCACHDHNIFIYIPTNDFHYHSYSVDGTKVAEGWLSFNINSDSTVSGEWHFDKIAGKPEEIGPQWGEGSLQGDYVSDTLWLELKPQYRDNNFQLRGTLNKERYSGKWYWITYAGVSGRGTFKANYKE